MASLAELFTWALRAKASPTRLQRLMALLKEVQLLEVNFDVARKFGEVEAHLLDRGLSAPDLVGLVILARQQGIIPAARPVLEQLRQVGLRLSDRVMNLALAQVGE